MFISFIFEYCLIRYRTSNSKSKRKFFSFKCTSKLYIKFTHHKYLYNFFNRVIRILKFSNAIYLEYFWDITFSLWDMKIWVYDWKQISIYNGVYCLGCLIEINRYVCVHILRFIKYGSLWKTKNYGYSRRTDVFKYGSII